MAKLPIPAVDVFDREAVFIERVLQPLLRDLPALRVVFEHITTKDAAQFVNEAPGNIAATITAHHLLYNRNAMLVGGIRPHYYCLPVLKRETHREALVKAATGGSKKFFLGTDSAPHAQHTKEDACGCAGCYTAHAAIELYAEAFEQAGALDKLEGFRQFLRRGFLWPAAQYAELSPCAKKSGKCLRQWGLANIVWCRCVQGK